MRTIEIEENLYRRQLTVADRAVLALKIIPMYAAEAAKRQTEGGRRGGQASALKSGSLEDRAPAESTAQAAAAVGVSNAIVKRARRRWSGARNSLPPWCSATERACGWPMGSTVTTLMSCSTSS